ncbi:MAG: sugar kinase [Defluviitaleaceae bacterium]|nr:sugar kinase [Defluviitaleaceae bacterium]
MNFVSFGEILLRLSPVNYSRFVQAESFGAVYGGSEANVAVSLACFGVNTSFVTKLPANEIGQAAVNSLRKHGINTSGIIRGGSRIGLYYLEKGASQRPSKVIYDRAGSAIAAADPSEFDWKNILLGADWFHFSGITPALSKSAEKCCLAACRAAKDAGLKISCDLNYRESLWSYEDARMSMEKLMPFADLCIINKEHASSVFGLNIPDNANTDPYKESARLVSEKFGIGSVALTLRESASASVNGWAGLLYTEKNYFLSEEYNVHIVDRVGAGDALAAGLIYSFLNGARPQDAIEFAVAASCLKHSVEGDANLVSADEVNKLVRGGNKSVGLIQR